MSAEISVKEQAVILFFEGMAGEGRGPVGFRIFRRIFAGLVVQRVPVERRGARETTRSGDVTGEVGRRHGRGRATSRERSGDVAGNIER